MGCWPRRNRERWLPGQGRRGRGFLTLRQPELRDRSQIVFDAYMYSSQKLTEPLQSALYGAKRISEMGEVACSSWSPERSRLGASERVRRFLTNMSFHSC